MIALQLIFRSSFSNDNNIFGPHCFIIKFFYNYNIIQFAHCQFKCAVWLSIYRVVLFAQVRCCYYILILFETTSPRLQYTYMHLLQIHCLFFFLWVMSFLLVKWLSTLLPVFVVADISVTCACLL